MRHSALLALVVSLLLGAIAVSVTLDNEHARRNEQDRALQAATGREIALISDGERQTAAVLSLMLVDPAVRGLLAGQPLSGSARHDDLANSALALATIERSSFVPLSAACLDDGFGRQLVCAPMARQATFPSRLGAEFAKLGCHVTGLDRYIPSDDVRRTAMDFVRWDLDRAGFPINVSQFDQIFLLDIIEHLKEPSHFMDELRFATGCKRPEIILTTANIGFFATRLMLLLGQFNYGKKGILDVTHTRLFTFRSIHELLTQSGYKIVELRGIPAPFPLALGRTFLARFLLALNAALIRLSKGLFAYQIFIRAEAMPTVNNLLNETISGSTALKAEVLGQAA